MSADQILLLAIGLTVIVAVAVTVAWATAYTTRRDLAATPPELAMPGLRDQGDGIPDLPRTAAPRSGRTFIAPTSTRQVARVVALLFLAGAAVIVALTGAWPETEAAVFTLLALGTLLVVLFMDLVPPAALARWRRPAEGVGAIVFLTLLTALSGGASSPFLVGFFLVVAGTALSTEGRAPLAIALLASASVALVGVLDALDGPLAPEAMAWVGITAVALILLADIATAAARAQRHARDEALRASRFDSLTGLYNRAFFFTTMEQEIRRSDRMGRDFTMLMLDLDDLKPVNDTFGHQWGDRLLRSVADAIRRTIRFTDAAARYGGDEFVVLLPETDAAGGYVVAEKLRRDVAALTLRAADRNVRSSVSVGLVTYPHDGATIEQLVAAADVAMYESKRRGKNRIVGYQTRTERIATAIDIGSVETGTPGPVTDVRTGGDPAPWDPAPGAASTARSRPFLTELGPGQGVQPAAIPVEPGATSPAGARQSPGTTRSAGAPGSPAASGSPGPAGSPGASGSPEAGPGPGPTPRPADAAWLTRTDDTRPAPPPDASSQRPAADLRASGRPTPGRTTSRRDETRGPKERPWIALPIEPSEPPERPKG